MAVYTKINSKDINNIEKNYNMEDVILWTDDKIDYFFLQIQGSGIGVFENKKEIKIVYKGNNNLAYTSIGNYLIKKKLIDPKKVSLFTIKNWLRKNKTHANHVMNKNQRYIFFEIQESESIKPPVGAFGKNLKPDFSIAVDNEIYPLGIPFLMEYLEYGRIKPVISLDTGSAIKGFNRADLFTGRGVLAERLAGNMKKKIYLHNLIPYSK